MPHSGASTKSTRGSKKPATKRQRKGRTRYTVGLVPSLASRVQQYAETVDTSMSKAIAALVHLGLEGQENRKREFFKKLKDNLANDDPNNEDRLVDEFRALILGR